MRRISARRACVHITNFLQFASLCINATMVRLPRPIAVLLLVITVGVSGSQQHSGPQNPSMLSSPASPGPSRRPIPPSTLSDLSNDTDVVQTNIVDSSSDDERIMNESQDNDEFIKDSGKLYVLKRE